MVKVVVKNFDSISTLLTEVENTQGLGVEVRVGATGLLRAITLHTQRSFLFIAHLVLKVSSLFEPPNRLLQAEDMDLFTVVTLVNTASDCLRTQKMSLLYCGISALLQPQRPRLPAPVRDNNKNLRGFTVEETVGQPQSDTDEKTEFKRLFYSVIDDRLVSSW